MEVLNVDKQRGILMYVDVVEKQLVVQNQEILVTCY